MKKHWFAGALVLGLCLLPLRGVAQVKTQELDAPEGTRNYGNINGGGSYKFVGRVHRVEFGQIDGAVSIDASRLVADEIIVHGNINGRSNVLLNSTGNVTIGGMIDGRSIVIVQAGGTFTLGGKVDGRSRVRVKARDIDLRGKVDGGPCTQMYFSAKRNFKIGDKIDGGAVLRELKIDHPFQMQGAPFEDDCRTQDPHEEPRYRIPERAKRIAELIRS